MVDVVRYERVLNGTAVRALHALNNRAYRGETLASWDDERKPLAHFNLTTAGGFSAEEAVKGAASAITHVRATTAIDPTAHCPSSASASGAASGSPAA